MNDPLIHIPLYLDEWHARLSGYDYLQRGAFITLFIAYVKSSGKLTMEGNNSALFRACGAITVEEQESLLEIYKEVKLFADPRIGTQTALREKRRENAKLGGIAKGLASAKPSAKVLAEQKVSKRSAKSELELESESKRELKEKDTIVSKKKVGETGVIEITSDEFEKLKTKHGEKLDLVIAEYENWFTNKISEAKRRNIKKPYLYLLKWDLNKYDKNKGVENFNIFTDEELEDEKNGLQ